ncbi:small conductance mechanosensitive channel [Apibacter mensalis]|uniref:Small conductance mechanosensitive channel n=1 Tax=Apibacter mensalis TaxID=1586267 RepID=A0A0X3AQJ0_9FLAO|nr:mechanosensitive ion channel domain-containing protein [Apibacter mensalis]CVK16632.1 small conductance mechanosensitive channel [Apibacter mensalis]
MNLYQVNHQSVSNEIINPTAIEKLLNKLIDLAYELGIKIVTCLVVYYLGWFLIKWIEKLFHKFLERRKIDPSVKSFLGSLCNITLNILLIMSIIGILGIQTTSFAALIASAGLAVGMAMKDNLGNFAGGVMILFNKPIKIGDHILAQNQEGVVQSIGILYTVLTTSDNKTIYIPNGPLSTGSILNFSTQPQRRIDITIGVDYGTSLQEVKDILEEIISSNSSILKSPEPFIGLLKLNDSSIDFVVRVWAESADYWPVYFFLNENIYEKFTHAKINIPFPQLTVHMADDNK